MGRRGPRSAAEMLMTLPRQRAALFDRPKLARDLPPPPGHLSTEAKAWWSEIVSEWPVQQHQLQTLQAAAESWDRCQQAREALAKHGLTFTDAKGMVRQRPEAHIERDAKVLYLRCMRELNFESAPPPPKRP